MGEFPLRDIHCLPALLSLCSYPYHGPEGRFSVNICGPSSSCSNRDAAVCLDEMTVIAYSSNLTIVIDGMQAGVLASYSVV